MLHDPHAHQIRTWNTLGSHTQRVHLTGLDCRGILICEDNSVRADEASVWIHSNLFEAFYPQFWFPLSTHTHMGYIRGEL
jgi:hypothetical protein